jgi:surfactin synthase thioesterase subunit
MTDHWFVCSRRRPQASSQLFCLPYAGAGASAFRGWPTAFGDAVEVHAVLLPGRESRYREPCTIEPHGIAAAIADRADRPFAIFGHSFGGRLAFDVTRALRQAGAPQPQRLYPSGCRPPHVRRNDGLLDGVADAEDGVLVDRLTATGGMPAELLAEPELLALLLPAMRADLRWLDSYRYDEQPPLTVPITAFAGANDTVVSPELMRGWARHTTGPFALHTLQGGHFFLHQCLAELAALIEQDLLDTVAGGRP